MAPPPNSPSRSSLASATGHHLVRVLLLEPDYYTRYPALGLLKLSSWHKAKGHSVQYIRGHRAIPYLKAVPDLVYVTSLFTWAWKPVHEATAFARLYFPRARVQVGGIYASLLPDHAAGSGGEVFKGLFPDVDLLLPDYDLVPEWHRKARTSILFTHRGCVNQCAFCAVNRLEGGMEAVVRGRDVPALIHPQHNKVVIWDNNFLANQYWHEIAERLSRMAVTVDFNQGLDARFLDRPAAKTMAELKLSRVRLAYDREAVRGPVGRALTNLAAAGFSTRQIVVYVLYGFDDRPEDFFRRIQDLLGWRATAYPMRFQPLDALEKDGYVAPGWTKEQMEVVAKARRVVGFGGAFPPYHGLREKILAARSFEEAFSVWDRHRAVTVPAVVRGSGEQKCVAFYESGRVVVFDRRRRRTGDKRELAEVVITKAESCGGVHAVLVSRRGRCKRLPLLALRQFPVGVHVVPLCRRDTVVSALILRGSRAFFVVTSRGRVAKFAVASVPSGPIQAGFQPRLNLEPRDRVVAAGGYTEGARVLLITRRGFMGTADLSLWASSRSSVRGRKLVKIDAKTGLVVTGALVDEHGRIELETSRGRRVVVASASEASLLPGSQWTRIPGLLPGEAVGRSITSCP